MLRAARRAVMRPRVLIVDDELGVRESLRTILDRECDVLTAASGDEALAVIGREPIDLVTLDLRMPGLGGIAVLERIRKIDPDIEAVIITGYGSLDTAIEGLRHRAFDYIAKPFDCDKVCGVVQAALARRLAARRLRSAPEQILATLSHEFRTPLNVIMGYSTMLRDEGETALSDEQRLALDRIQSNSIVASWRCRCVRCASRRSSRASSTTSADSPSRRASGSRSTSRARSRS